MATTAGSSGRPPTLAEVAARAGVSMTAASRVINNAPHVSRAKREAVEKAVSSTPAWRRDPERGENQAWAVRLSSCRLGAVSPSVSRTLGIVVTGTRNCCFEHACQTLLPVGPCRATPGLCWGGAGMDVVYERCAGIDISKTDVKVCIRTPGPGRRRRQVRTFTTMTNDLLAMRDWLLAERVTVVGMEATGAYWKPVYYLLEHDLDCWLLNARHMKAVPGRKTDVKDCEWIAQLVEHGLVRAGFVPPEPIRQLRDLTRYRTEIIRERTREIQRLEKLLEDAGVKLSAVVSDLTGKSARAMLEALIGGERDPQTLADLALAGMRGKRALLAQALTGRFGEHHAFLARAMLDRIDACTAMEKRLSDQIDRPGETLSPPPPPIPN